MDALTSRIASCLAPLRRAGLATRSNMVGCLEQDLKRIEAEFCILLPRAYRAFLTLCGSRCGKFMEGTDLFCSDLLSNRFNAEYLLVECNVENFLLEKDFVFAVHQGYEFLYFTTGESDDPPVKRYIEDDCGPVQVSSSFSEWLRRAVYDEVVANN